MTQRTDTYDDAKWRLVPLSATNDMLMGLRERVPDIAKIIRKDKGASLELSCDFGLVYRLLVAAAPIHPPARAPTK